MTASLMEERLTYFNAKMKRQKRKMLLFLDNVTCHPHITMSNVELVFFPANTTSLTQPMDQGVIRSLKVHYRRFVLHFLVAKMDSCSNVTELTKSIDVLKEINRVAQAFKKVLSSTVQKCFAHAGFGLPTEDSFEENYDDLHELVAQCHLDVDVQSLISFDDALSTEEALGCAADFVEVEIGAEEEEKDDKEDEEEANGENENINSYAECI